MKNKLIFGFMLLLSLAMFSCKSEDNEPLSISGDQDEDNTTAVLDESYTYKLPVIFHVLYTNASDTNQYVTQKRIIEILNNVNELWNTYKFEIDSLGNTQKINVEFVLANTNEQGKPLTTPGIEYVKYDGEYPIDSHEFMKSSLNKKYVWEPNEFINIMLFNFKENEEATSTELGISSLPYCLNDSTKLEGLEQIKFSPVTKKNLSFTYCVCINSLYQSRSYESNRYSYYNRKWGQPLYYSGLDINNTMAHELGHYLGLHHVFAEAVKDGSTVDVDSCADTDYCKDTYTYNHKEYIEYLKYITQTKENLTMQEVARRNDCLTKKQYKSTNFMDYWAGFSNVFTKEQKQRIRHVLYYSPLIPGPKRNKSNGTRAVDAGYMVPNPIICN